MKLEEIIRRNRSYRRFKEDEPLDLATVRGFVDLARLSASGANMQPLKYIISTDPETNALIFPRTSWAGYLPDWKGPAEGERPVAYVIILGDTTIAKSFGCDHGIAAQSIMLGAAEEGWGGCVIGSIDRGALRQALDIAPEFEILLILALGRPAEEVEIEALGVDGSIKYYRDADDVHHVPKRSLDDLIVAAFSP